MNTGIKRRSGFQVMSRLIGLVKPLTGFMLLAILMGLIGHLCAAFITIFGGYAVLEALHFDTPFTLTAQFVCVVVFAIAYLVIYAFTARTYTNIVETAAD